MKKILLSVFTFVSIQFVHAQCATLNAAMVNACGVSEGNNEFVMFTTAVSAAANTYIVNYGTANPPTTNRMSGVDIKPKTGAGVISATGGCTINFVATPTDVIPAGAKVIFIPAGTDNNYDITGLCGGTGIYVAYINNVAPITGTTSWTAGGVLVNTATTNRFLQVTSATAGCNSAGAPAVAYLATSFAANADGNMVTWNAGVPSYSNNGCNNVVLALENLNVTVTAFKDYNLLKWDIGNETNIRNFVIEKSNDGNAFSEIGSVNASSVSIYSFKDINVSKSVSFYRIRVTQNDNKIVVSDIVKVNNNLQSANELSCYPRVTNNNIHVQWFSETKINTSITIIDVYGRIVLNKNIVTTIGLNRNSIDVNQFAAGQYFVRVNNENKKMTDSFIKQ
jgi:Secretion system C-terminal sorting domain